MITASGITEEARETQFTNADMECNYGYTKVHCGCQDAKYSRLRNQTLFLLCVRAVRETHRGASGAKGAKEEDAAHRIPPGIGAASRLKTSSAK